jgi:uncharacterized membrane protein YfcA
MSDQNTSSGPQTGPVFFIICVIVGSIFGMYYGPRLHQKLFGSPTVQTQPASVQPPVSN